MSELPTTPPPSERVIWQMRPEKHKDVSRAAAHGMLYEVFREDTSPLNMRELCRTFEQEVAPHASADDLILVVGPSVQLMAFAAQFYERFHRLNFLVLDRHSGEYIERRFPH